jgi:DNA mismatch repair protein MutL
MQKIKILSACEAQKIAAGEVVERPANIVKELIENSLDAQATDITIYIENGGKSLIQVIDNGFGMSPEDARMSVMHHATSKIVGINDLEQLTTFGFRGEALSSISAVSHMTITTKENDRLEGIKLTISGGNLQKDEITSCITGTTMTLQDLFYNVPARKKFLKSKDTEWRVIHQSLQALFLAHPHCSFKVYHDQKLSMDCPATVNIIERVSQLFDRDIADAMLTCRSHSNITGIHIHGCIGQPHYNRYDRNNIFFFVNKRWVKNYKLGQALLKGYQDILPTQRFPAAFIFIDIRSEEVDINIHPRKEEVQFLHPRTVETTLEQLVKQRLEEHHGSHFIPPPQAIQPFSIVNTQNSFKDPAPFQPKDGNLNKTSTHDQEFMRMLSTNFSLPSTSQQPATLPPEKQPNTIDSNTSGTTLTITAPGEQPTYTLKGQLHTTYILIETETGLVLVDQHAAHERILYELYAQRFNCSESTALLFPLIIPLSNREATLLNEHSSLFESFGIILEQAGPQHIAIRNLPVYLKDISFEELLKQTVSWINELQQLAPADLRAALQKKLQAQMACKAAIKAGTVLNTDEMHELLRKLYQCPNKLTCPHGRPTLHHISLVEIERIFKR